MSSNRKTKAQLLEEITDLRQRIDELEALKAKYLRMQEALRESEEQYRSLFFNNHSIMLLVDPETGDIVDANPAACTFYGHSREEITTKKITDINMLSEEEVFEEMEQAKLEKRRHFLFRHRVASGEIRDVEVYSGPIKVQGRQLLYSIIYNISERKQIEAALRESQELFALFMDRLPHGVFVKDEEHDVTYVNQYMRDLFDAHNWLGKDAYAAFPKELAEAMHADDDTALKQGQTTVEEAMPDKHGVRHVFRTTKFRIDRADKPPLLGGLGLDITERIQAEEAYHSLVEHSLQGLTIIQDMKVVFANQAFADISGYSVEELMSMPPDQMRAFVHPEDQAEVWGRYQDRLAGKDIPMRNQFRGIRKDNVERWLEMHASLIEYNGKPAVQAAFLDITERKQAEEALRLNLAKTEALYRVSQSLIAQENLSDMLKVVVENVAKGVGVDRVTIITFNLEQKQVTNFVYGGPGANEDIVSFDELMEGLTGWVIRELKPALSPHDHPDPRESETVQRHRLEVNSGDLIVVPLRYRNKTVGTMTAINRPNQRRLTQEDVDLMMVMGSQAAIAIANAQLYEQARQNAETNETLLKEVNHRVKNNLAAIAGMLYIERRHAQQAQVDRPYPELIQDLTWRIEGLATVHRLLSASEWSPLQLSELVEQILNSTLQTLPPGKRVVTDMSSCSSAVQVTPKQANNLAMVINELATNVIKYAMPARQTAQITIRISQDSEVISLDFRDNGPGFPEDVLRLEQQNVGMYLVRNLIQGDLGGEIELQNDGGAVVMIRFPLAVE